MNPSQLNALIARRQRLLARAFYLGDTRHHERAHRVWDSAERTDRIIRRELAGMPRWPLEAVLAGSVRLVEPHDAPFQTEGVQ